MRKLHLIARSKLKDIFLFEKEREYRQQIEGNRKLTLESLQSSRHDESRRISARIYAAVRILPLRPGTFSSATDPADEMQPGNFFPRLNNVDSPKTLFFFSCPL